MAHGALSPVVDATLFGVKTRILLEHEQANDSPKAARVRVKKELIFAALGLAFGFLLLPWLVYLVGQSLFGGYGGGLHKLGSFYGDLFRDLAAANPDSWGLVLGPFIALSLLRLAFYRRTEEPSAPPKKQEPPQNRSDKARKEPTLSL